MMVVSCHIGVSTGSTSGLGYQAARTKHQEAAPPLGCTRAALRGTGLGAPPQRPARRPALGLQARAGLCVATVATMATEAATPHLPTMAAQLESRMSLLALAQ